MCSSDLGPDKADPTCPRVAVVGELGRVTYFRAGLGRDITDITAEAEMEVRGIKCSFNRNNVDMEFDIAILASAGPADRTRSYGLDYFVGVMDPEGNMTRHESFRVQVQFTGNQPRQAATEPMATRIPVRDRARAPNYSVVVGFQLTDEQLQWNQGRRRAN